jgi:hypothetical protein
VNKPSIVPLSNEIAIKKISCGRLHSLLLSQNGDIYWFGFNGVETQTTPKKLTLNSSKFIDIASHYDYTICVAQTEDWVYVWGKCTVANFSPEHSGTEKGQRPFVFEIGNFYFYYEKF